MFLVKHLPTKTYFLNDATHTKVIRYTQNYLSGYSPEEIAEIKNQNIGQYKMQFSRMKRKMEKSLKCIPSLKPHRKVSF